MEKDTSGEIRYLFAELFPSACSSWPSWPPACPSCSSCPSWPSCPSACPSCSEVFDSSLTSMELTSAFSSFFCFINQFWWKPDQKGRPFCNMKLFKINYLVFLISRQQNLVCDIITSSSFLSDDFASSDFDVMSTETEVVSFLSTAGVVAVVGFLTSFDGASFDGASFDGASFWTTLSGEVSTI